MSEGRTSRGLYVGSIDEPCTSTCSTSRRSAHPSAESTSTTPKSSRSLNLKMFSSTECSSASGVSPRKEGTKRAKIISAGQSFGLQKQKIVQVHTLEKECLTVGVEPKCRVVDVYACCCSHLGIEDDRFFGLAQRLPSEGIGGDRPRNEYFFLELEHKVSKYLPRHSKFARSTSIEKNRPQLVLYLRSTSIEKNRPQLVLYLRVRVYIEKIPYISCDASLKYYYLQLRENLVDQWSGPHTVSEERCWEMAMLALQADKYDNQVGFFRAENYFPLWVINLRGLDYVKQNMPKVLRDFRKANEREAMISFCQEASRSPFALNCHLYGLRRHKMDVRNNALLGITDRGIDMWDVGDEGDRIPLRSLAFNRIARLCFDKKRLTICGLEGSRMSLYASSNDSARYLLRFCREVHLQQIQTNIFFAQHPESLASVALSGWGREQGVDTGERHSLVSQTSNSTSGIVSDRQHSDAEKEIDAETSSVAHEVFRPLTPVRSETEEEDEECRDQEVAQADVTRPPPVDTSARAGSSAYASASSSVVNCSETHLVELHPGPVSTRAASAELAKPPPLPSTARYVQNLRKTNGNSKSDDSSYLPNLVTLSEPSGSPPLDTNAELYSLGHLYSNEPSLMTQSTIVPTGLPYPQLPSLSMHDLRPVSSSAVPIRQPPCYSEATSVLRGAYAPSPPSAPLLSPQQRPIHHQKPRWTTVSGLDPQLVAMMEQMQMEQSARNAFHQARSEPRLHQIWNNVASPAVLPEALPTMSYAVPPQVPHSQPPQGGRRYKSRSPSNRGINRVRSMPAHSVAHDNFHELPSSLAQHLSGLHHAQSLNQGSSRVLLKPNTGYDRPLEAPLGPPFVPQRGKRNSVEEPLRSDDFSRIKDFPMMSALWQEHQRGIASSPSTSSSDAPALRQQSSLELRSSPPRRPSFSCQDLSAPSQAPAPTMSTSLHAGYPPRSVADALPANLNWERYLVLPAVSSAEVGPATNLYATEPTSSRSYLPYATSVLLQQNLDGRTSGTYSPAFTTHVLDLPPPPPYPQSSPNSRKAPMVM
uniref:FERM domain-containing protein n=2 Tax=Steinernema glaseri TaxID=37863 RepID=A0A1I7Z8I1_9BILA